MGLEQGVLAALAVFLAGVIYHAGRLSARVDNLDIWRREMAATIKDISAAAAALERYVNRRGN